MAAPTVIIAAPANDAAPAVGGLFEGLSFFLVMRLPQRSTFINKIQVNGGRVVKLEAQADYIIADHLRREAPAGSISYNFIDRAIRDGQVPDPADHRAGPAVGVVRPAASGLPTRSTRTPFTEEDDLILWDWVEGLKSVDVRVKGNEIYKQLEAANPRHTFQSWRDRYLKKLLGNPPPGRSRQQSTANQQAQSNGSSNYAQTEDEEAAEASAVSNATSATQTDADAEFKKDPFGQMLIMAADIENIHPNRLAEAWDTFAQAYPGHNGPGWRRYYEHDVRPVYLKRQKEQIAIDGKKLAKGSGDGGDVGERGEELEDEHALEVGGVEVERAEEDIVDEGEGQEREAVQASPHRNGGQQFGVASGPVNQETEHTRKRSIDSLPSSERREGKRQKAVLVSPSTGAEQTSPDRHTPTMPPNATQASNGVIEFASDDEDVDEELDEANQGALTLQLLPEAERPSPDERQVASRNLLTEKNLASQQAQHRKQPLKAADLEKDDENKSQTGFINDLRNLIPESLLNRGQMAVLSQRAQEALQQELEEERGDDDDDEDVEWDATPPKPSRDATQIAKAVSGDAIDDRSQDGIAAFGVSSGIGGIDERLQWSTSPEVSVMQIIAHQTEETDDLKDDFLRQGAADLSHAGESAQELDRNDHTQYNGSGRHLNDAINGDVDEEHDDNNDKDDVQSSEGDDTSSDIDLDVPEPQGGFPVSSPTSREYWNAVPPRTTSKAPAVQTTEVADVKEDEGTSPSSSPSSSSALFVRDRDRQREYSDNFGLAKALETQDILNGETQPLDFNMPPPLSPDDDLQDLTPAYQSSPPTQRGHQRYASDLSSSRSGPINQPTQYTGIDDFTDAMAYRGFSESSIHQALFKTSMDADLAEYVLLAERAGRGVPDDLPGIWSAKEDDLVRGTDAPALRPVIEKHTMVGCQARLAFLYEWDEG